MNPAFETTEDPFWSYEDIALFIGSVIPCLAISALLMRILHFSSEGSKALTFQSIFYILLLAMLYVLIARRYSRPFWRSLGFTPWFRGAGLCVLTGPALAIGLAALGALLHAPGSSAVQDLMTDRRSIIVVVIFGSLLGPLFEELVFRGFLLPLLVKSLGVPLGIVLTAVPFALLHGSQYRWAWQPILIVGLAGVVFGFARVKAGSTTASTLIHMTYNATLFTAYLAQTQIAK